MKQENRKIISHSSQGHDDPRLVDHKRRSFAKAGIVAPFVLSLTSKAALGGGVYQCSISGAQSGNQSSHASCGSGCNVGISPGGWWQNACKSGNQSGCINDWCLAQVNPFPIQYAKLQSNTTTSRWGSGSKVQQIDSTCNGNWIQATNSGSNEWLDVYNAISSKFGNNATATSFSSIFGYGPSNSLWYVLNNSQGSLEWDAIADYLNASLYYHSPFSVPSLAPVYSSVQPNDVVNLYLLAKGQISGFTTSGGTQVSSSFQAATYLQNIHG